MIGKIQYTAVKVLRMQQPNDYRRSENPFKEILQGKFKKTKQIKLKNYCKRIAIIEGDIGAAVLGALSR